MSNDSQLNSKLWELSLYELHREPHPLLPDDTEIAVNPRSLRSEFTCPICLDLLRTTMTTKECLHRFCSECIITSLRTSNKECPTCRKKLVSKRSLRPDPNFDTLIKILFPSNGSSDNDENSFEDKTSHTNGSTNGRKKIKSNDKSDLDMDETEASRASESDGDSVTNNEIELIFKPLALETEDPLLNKTRFMKTTGNATVDHLIKYFSMRYELEAQQDDRAPSAASSSFEIYVPSGPGQFQPLTGQTTLEQIIEKYGKVNKPLELLYAYSMGT